jgi:hypothetical protein
MIKLEIHSEQVNLKDQWSDITLKEAIALYKVAKKLPDHVVSLYEEKLKDKPDEKLIDQLSEKITIEEHQKKLPQIYGELIALLSNIRPELLKKLGPGERRVLYDHFLAQFVLGLLFWPAYKSEGIAYFSYKGTKYFLPMSSTLHNYIRPGVDLSALEFTEVADLQIAANHLEEGRFTHASKIIAILCRPKGETYDEQICGNRANEFLSLTMDKVWEVFFSLVECTIISQQHSLLSTLQAELDQLKDSKLKHTAGTPALSRLRKLVPLVHSKKLKKRTRTTS